MQSSSFDFHNRSGRLLSGVLETGAEKPHAYAVFAHCFTCDKTSHAAVRISRGLASRGIGVLRFDFTGLGESDGADLTGLSSNIEDVVDAATAMNSAGRDVQILIGHSFGGVAAIGAASQIEGVQSVAVIGAPFDAGHVLNHVVTHPAVSEAASVTEASIGGRSFTLAPEFVRDLEAHDPRERVSRLGKAILVLHSPLDDVVSIDHASQIFLAARHPKSFVSLDNADHLLRNKDDADYCATVIAAWATRYISSMKTDSTREIRVGVRVAETGEGKFQVRVDSASGHFLADEPESVGGLGSGPTPYELMSAALGACTVMTCRLYADRKGWALANTVVNVTHARAKSGGSECFTRRVNFEGDLDEAQRARLLEIADKCPVHRTLSHATSIRTVTDEASLGQQRGESLHDQESPEDHMAQAEDECDQADI